MSYEGGERRRWWMRPWRVVYGALREFGHDPPPSSRWHHIWRDFVPLLAILIAAYAVLGIESKVDRAEVKATTAEQVAASQREGRRNAVAIVCGATSAIIEAGRASILSGGELPPRLERNLIRLGYPERAERRAQARAAAEAYSLGIAGAIEKESGVQGLVRADGTLDCDRLLKASRVEP
jgi:hypothetical protein